MPFSDTPENPKYHADTQLRAMLDRMTEACCILNADWRFTYLNHEAERLAGKRREELIGRSLWEALPALTDTVFEEQFRKAQTEQVPVSFEAQFPRVNRWFACQVYPSANDLSVFCRDITAQKQTEASLHQSEARQRLALDAAGMATYTYDLRTGTITWMENMEQLFGLLPGAFGANFEHYVELVHPDDRDTFQSVVDRAIAECGTYQLQTRILWPDGTLRWLARRGKVVCEEGGKPTYITGVCWDVTEAKQQEQVVRETEERFRALADTAPVMVWMSGLDTLCHFFNQPWFDFTGRTLEQEMGNGWAEGVHPDDLQHCLHIYLSSFHARQPFRMEYRLRRQDGEYRWLLDSGVPRFAPDGTFVGYIGSGIDIHDLREAQNEILALNAHLSLALDETNHQVRNNLQLITAMLDMTLMEYENGTMPTAEGKRVAAQISTLAAVHDVLTRQFRFTQEPSGLVSGRDLIEYLLPLLQKVSPGARFTSAVEAFSLPTRQATALALILNELTSNAAKFGKGSVRVTCRLNGQLVILEVEDDGPGFPTGFDERKVAKMGLTLTGTLGRHDLGGTLVAENRAEGGAKVTVTFPMASK